MSSHSIRRLAIPFGLIAGTTALGLVIARRRAHSKASSVIATVTINKPPSEVHAFFRMFDQLPRFMNYLESVQELDDKRSRWTAKVPGGRTVSWEAELVEDQPEVLAWQTVKGSPVETSGRVTFTKTPGHNMTEVRVEMELGVLRIGPRRSFARLFAKPQVKGDLRRLKQVLETGEVLLSDASAHRLPHPAQPPEPGTVEVHPELLLEIPPAAVKGVTP